MQGHGTDYSFQGRSLRKIYQTGETQVHALRGVDLDIPKGEIVLLLGPSGSGKSTLLNIVGGLDRPTSGTLHFGDTELTALDDADLTRFRRQSIGFIFQFYNLIPSLTAEENVAIGADPSRALPMLDGSTRDAVAQTDLVLAPVCPVHRARNQLLEHYQSALTGHARVALTPCFDAYVLPLDR